MDKTGFLKELKRYLAVLNEGEQKDILDEYAQHIDMKMERGMSESEAIKEFGDIGELAAEILEAYHVNPQYGAKKHTKFTIKEEIPMPDIAETGRKFWSNAAGFFKKAGRKAAGMSVGLWRAVKKSFQLIGKAWRNRKYRMGSSAGLMTQRPAKDYAVVRRKNMVSEVPGMSASGIWKIFRAFYYMAAWCVRWAWNACMMFIASMIGIIMLLSLFGLGTLAVLLSQGYPLAGLMLGSLGLVLCTGALLAIAICLCRFRGSDTRVDDSGVEMKDTRKDNAGLSNAGVKDTEYEVAFMEKTNAEEVPEHV